MLAEVDPSIGFGDWHTDFGHSLPSNHISCDASIDDLCGKKYHPFSFVSTIPSKTWLIGCVILKK